MLTISRNQLEAVKNITRKYMHESMLYKLGISESDNSKGESIRFNYLKNIDNI